MDRVDLFDGMEVVIGVNVSVLGQISSHDSLRLLTAPRRSMLAARFLRVDKQRGVVAGFLHLIESLLLHTVDKWSKHSSGRWSMPHLLLAEGNFLLHH